MKLREKFKRFWTMDVHNHEGFTLVELIIVIAILAILSGVAVAGYSSYIKKANMQADKTLVSEVINALTLHYYDSFGYEGVSTIVLTPEGAVLNANDKFASDALTAAFGSTANLKLKYTGWAGAITNQTVINHFNSADGSLKGVYDGTYVPTFANDIEDLFEMVKDVSTSIAGDETEGANLVKGAAAHTTAGAGTIKDEDDFVAAWMGGSWKAEYLMSDGSKYDGNANQLEGDLLKQAMANAAVLKARNTVIAGYVRDNMKTYCPTVTDAELNAVYNVFANYNYTINNVETIVPLDVATVLSGQGTEEDKKALSDDLAAAFNGDESKIEVAKELAVIYCSGEVPEAKNDALAYYAMMDTVDTVSASSNETYWDEMSDAVGLYAAIARGEVTLSDLYNSLSGLAVEGSAIMITAIMKDGEITITVTPAAANP